MCEPTAIVAGAALAYTAYESDRQRDDQKKANAAIQAQNAKTDAEMQAQRDKDQRTIAEEKRQLAMADRTFQLSENPYNHGDRVLESFRLFDPRTQRTNLEAPMAHDDPANPNNPNRPGPNGVGLLDNKTRGAVGNTPTGPGNILFPGSHPARQYSSGILELDRVFDESGWFDSPEYRAIVQPSIDMRNNKRIVQDPADQKMGATKKAAAVPLW